MTHREPAAGPVAWLVQRKDGMRCFVELLREEAESHAKTFTEREPLPGYEAVPLYPPAALAAAREEATRAERERCALIAEARADLSGNTATDTDSATIRSRECEVEAACLDIAKQIRASADERGGTQGGGT